MAAIWTLKMLWRGNDELWKGFLKTMGRWRPDGRAMSNEEAVTSSDCQATALIGFAGGRENMIRRPICIKP